MSDHLPESLLLTSWLSNMYTVRKGLDSEWSAQANPGTKPNTTKLKTASHLAEQSCWLPWSYCSPPVCPFPIKFLALSACVSSDNSCLSVKQELTPGPWKGPPFLQHSHFSLPWAPHNLGSSSAPSEFRCWVSPKTCPRLRPAPAFPPLLFPNTVQSHISFRKAIASEKLSS